jgi:predicted small lipoprotein YifL
LYYSLKAKKMKKVVFMFVAIAAMSLASCGNKKADAEKAAADSIRIADSIAAVEAAEAAAADTIVVDTTVVAE